MINTLITQLSLDYCCLPEQITDSRNHFTVYSRQEGRRKFQEGNDCFLKIAALNGKLLFTGREDIVEACRSRYQDADGAWFMDVKNLAELEKLLSSYGYRIEQAHPFFIAADPSPVDTDGFEIRRYEGKEIEQFRGDERFDEAFAFCEDAPDVLGIAALQDGKILGMAGASADSPYLWQIGINVQPEARRKNIAAMLVTLLKNDILKNGRIPYYGTSMSHIASQRVALRAGFLPAWSELVTSPLPDRLRTETENADFSPVYMNIIQKTDIAPASRADGYTIRPAEGKDAESYYEQGFHPVDPEVARLTGAKMDFTHDEVVNFFRQCIEADDRYDFLILDPDGQIIGESVINEIDRELRSANYRIALFHSDQCGRGIGSWAIRTAMEFAFDELKLHRLELDVYSFNPRAEKAYLAAGFRREGVLQDAVLDGDQYADDILMAVLENEWRAR